MAAPIPAPLQEVLRRLRSRLHLAQAAGVDAMVVAPADLAAVLQELDKDERHEKEERPWSPP